MSICPDNDFVPNYLDFKITLTQRKRLISRKKRLFFAAIKPKKNPQRSDQRMFCFSCLFFNTAALKLIYNVKTLRHHLFILSSQNAHFYHWQNINGRFTECLIINLRSKYADTFLRDFSPKFVWKKIISLKFLQSVTVREKLKNLQQTELGRN